MSTAEALATRTEENELPHYKQLLLTVKAMQAKTGVELHKRIKLLLEVYYDDEFRASVAGRSGLAPDDWDWQAALDPYCEDVFLGYDRQHIASPFAVLKAIYESFPERAHWRRHPLSRLLQMHWDRRKQMAKQEPQKKRRTDKIPKEEYDRLIKRYQTAVERIDAMQEQLRQCRSAPSTNGKAALAIPPAVEAPTTTPAPVDQTTTDRRSQAIAELKAWAERYADLRSEWPALFAAIEATT